MDGHDYHTFQPLLYQVSTGYLAPEEVGAALRAVFRRQANVRVRIGKASRGWTTRLKRSFSRAAPGSTLTT